MSNLKKENVNKCFSLLSEFIEGVGSENSNKGIALLALNQLEKITAGATEEPSSACTSIPRAIGEASNLEAESACTSIPRAIG